MRIILIALGGVFMLTLTGCWGHQHQDPAGDADTRPDYYDRRPLYDNQPGDNDRHFELDK